MSNVLPWENEEEQNYIYMAKCVIDVVSKGLRKIFKQEWDKRYQAKFGKWDDTNVSGKHFLLLEKKGSRPTKKEYQPKFQHGDTNKWDCSVLFAAILYSNSIGLAGLNPAIKREVDNLREIRNEITHVEERKLSNTDFQDMTTRAKKAFISLGLPINEINQITVQKNRYNSFQLLPPKPVHKVVSRSEKIKQIRQDLEKMHSDNGAELTYFYISGNPGSGKSQLARQVCEDIYNLQTEKTFVMKLDGKDLDSLFYSYQDFCRRLDCNENVIENIVNSSKPNMEKIKDLRSQVTTKLKNWKRWWVIVDNVENLAEISPLLPLKGDEVWNNGQIILTTQNRTSVPPDDSFNKHVSLSLGMNKEECHQLLSSISGIQANDDPLLDEVAKKLDRQPLAMAAAAVYVKQVTVSNCPPDFSWQDYLGKLEEGKRTLTEERLLQINSAYSSTMTAAMFLAVKKCAENNILNFTFHLYSLISFKPLPIDLIVQYIHLQDKELDKQAIRLKIELCSLFLPSGDESHDISLHRVVHEAINHFVQSETVNVESIVPCVVKTLYYFKDRDDKIKLILHLQAFHTGIKNLFPSRDPLYSVSSSFKKTEISEMFLFFAETLHEYCHFDLSIEFLNSNIQILKGSKYEIHMSDVYTELGSVYNDLCEQEKAKEYHHMALKIRKKKLGQHDIKVADSYNHLGTVYHDEGDLKKAKDYYERALEIRKDQLGPNDVKVAASYNNLGILYSDNGEPDKAVEYYKQTLEIEIARLGPNHDDVADTYDNLGTAYFDTGAHEIAMDCHQRAIEILTEQFGSNHIKLATSFDNLGTVHYAMKDIEMAKKFCQQALEIRKEQLPSNHVDIGDSFNNLGSMYMDTDDLETAESYLQRGLEIRKEKLGPKHGDLARCYNNLGQLYHKMGDLEKAQGYHQWAMEIRNEQLGPNQCRCC